MPAASVELPPKPALQTPAALAKSLPHADRLAIASLPGSRARAGEGGYPGKTPPTAKKKARLNVAKTSPGEFINQVRSEGRKVVWPTRKETVTTAIMVLIMTTLLAIFFLGVDAFFSSVVKYLLGLLG